MKLLLLRVMLFHARIDHALAIIGGNRVRAAESRQEEIRWEGEIDVETLLRYRED